MIELIEVISRMIFRGYVVAMVTLIYDNKAVYALPLGVIIAIGCEAKHYTK